MTLNISLKVDISDALKDIEAFDDRKVRFTALNATVEYARAKVSRYAPETKANRPPGGYYRRGTGWVSNSGRIYRTSEDLQQRWTTFVTQDEAKLSNNASYARFVVGDRQAGFHKARGWPSVPDFADDQQEVDEIGRVYVRSVERQAG